MPSHTDTRAAFCAVIAGHTSILPYCTVVCVSLTDCCFYRSCCCYRTLRREKCLVHVGNRTTQIHNHQVCSLATIPTELPRLLLLYWKRTVDILRRIIVLWSCGGAVGWGHCATRRKVAGSSPDGAFRIFHRRNPFGRSMALGSTQPMTEMITMNISRV